MSGETKSNSVKLRVAKNGETYKVMEASVYINQFDDIYTVFTADHGLSKYNSLNELLEDWALLPAIGSISAAGIELKNAIVKELVDTIEAESLLGEYKGKWENLNEALVMKGHLDVPQSTRFTISMRYDTDKCQFRVSLVNFGFSILYESYADIKIDWNLVPL